MSRPWLTLACLTLLLSGCAAASYLPAESQAPRLHCTTNYSAWSSSTTCW
jgi:hypothetical protein